MKKGPSKTTTLHCTGCEFHSVRNYESFGKEHVCLCYELVKIRFPEECDKGVHYVSIGEEDSTPNDCPLSGRCNNADADAMIDIVTTLINSDHECTAEPYWLILDPKQMLRLDPHYLASMITGPFFSREDAQNFLSQTRYNFSDHAVVYCNSGTYSKKYRSLLRALTPQ